MCQQFRFASEGQSRSSRLLAERSPVCKHRLCRFGGNAVVMSRAAGSDDLGKGGRGFGGDARSVVEIVRSGSLECHE